MEITEKVPLGTQLEKPCADCGGRLLLSLTEAGLGYICENRIRTGCMGNLGAYPDGSPMGIPGTGFERALRTTCHMLVDQLLLSYRDKDEKEKEAYEILRYEFVQEGRLDDGQEFHFGNLLEEDLRIAMKLIKTKLKRRLE